MNQKKFWGMMWSLGLAGQLCWNIENQWFNTFIYAKIAKDSNIVTAMVILSALVTTFSTFLFGTWSDRLGSRKKFISIGYIVWGALTILFGLTEFITHGGIGATPKTIMLASILVVLTDCVLSFFGSMGNDSGYSAWSNDMTTDANRGQVGAVLAIMPIIGTIVGTLVGGMLIGENDNYQRLFWTMGIFVILVGIISLFLLEDQKELKPHKEGTFKEQFKSVFYVGDFFQRKELLLVCVTTCVFFIAFNIYFVHMGNWMIHRMGFGTFEMGLIQGISLLAASLLTIPAISLINQNKTPVLASIAVLVNMVGLWVLAMFVSPTSVNTAHVFSKENLVLFLAVFLSGAGYVLVVQSMTMWVKELYPEESKGQFEGVRVFFFTLAPMFIGTLIGNIVIKTGAGTVVNEMGMKESIPTESIYLWAAVIVVFTFLPLYFAKQKYYQRKTLGMCDEQ